MILRRATPDDVPRILEIRAEVRENRLADPAAVRRPQVLAFIDRGRIHVAGAAAGVDGFSAANPEDGFLWALFVAPRAEGRGLGGALLAAALDDLRAAGLSRARLETDPGTRAEAFYRRRGWTELGLNDKGEMLMELALT
ncbi:MAG: GNAT family N-acetyltransferase [Pseudomonadota bacterium]